MEDPIIEKTYCPKCNERVYTVGSPYRGFLDQHIAGEHRQCEYSVWNTKVRPEIAKVRKENGDIAADEFIKMWS